MPETISIGIESVDGPNASGWYEVVLEDNRKASTKSEELAKVAFQSRGTIADVTLSEVKKGKFTNIYLNEINGVKDSPPKRTTSSGGSAAPTATGHDEKSERIARQWAYGRSVELLVASDMDFTFPLSDEQMKALSAQAATLLSLTK